MTNDERDLARADTIAHANRLRSRHADGLLDENDTAEIIATAILRGLRRLWGREKETTDAPQAR